MTTPVALQLWTLRTECEQDFTGTLEAVAGMGYAGVEVVDALSNGGLSGPALRTFLEDLGLAPAGCHAFYEALDTELDRLVEFSLGLGNRHLVCAWLPPGHRQSRDDYLRVAARLTEVGERCHDAGLSLLYHHHEFELAPLGPVEEGGGGEGGSGETGLDLILGATDPELVGVEADVYWALVGGLDPAEHLRRLGRRCPLVHLKDHMTSGTPLGTPAEGVASYNTEVGTGMVDFDAVIAASQGTARWYIVEQDLCPGPPLESARTSLANLREMGYAP